MNKNMFRAIYKKDINLIKTILDEGYDINFSNSLGETAIFKAVISNDFNIVEIILSKNPRLDKIYENGCKILHIACQIANINVKIIEVLLEKIENINEQDSMGNTPLFYIVREPRPNLEIIEILLKKGAKIDVMNKRGISSLSLMNIKDKKEVLELFSKFN